MDRLQSMADQAFSANTNVTFIPVVVLICAFVMIMSIYRRRKIEREINGESWKIDPHKVLGFPFEGSMFPKYDSSKVSRPSLNEMKNHNPNPCDNSTIAHYKEIVTRLKELRFSENKIISREEMVAMRELTQIKHENLNTFMGACVETQRIVLFTEFCDNGSLRDVISGENEWLGSSFVSSLLHDLIEGMKYIHGLYYPIAHGNLKSTNCLITSRWVLKISDFGLRELRDSATTGEIDEDQYYRNLFFKAPEVLRNPEELTYDYKQGDYYSFAIVLYELITKTEPFKSEDLSSKGFHESARVNNDNIHARRTSLFPIDSEIIERVKEYPKKYGMSFRPRTDHLVIDYTINVMTDCWKEDPKMRPNFKDIGSRLKRTTVKRPKDRTDLLESYSYYLRFHKLRMQQYYS